APWSRIRRASFRVLAAPLFLGAASGSRGADARGVGVVLRVIQEPALIGFQSQRRQHVVPGAVALPAAKAIVGGLARAVTLGHIAPGRAAEKDPEDSFDHGAMIAPHSTARGSTLRRQQRLDPDRKSVVEGKSA